MKYKLTKYHVDQVWKRYLTNFKKELTSNEENGTDFFAYISVISPTTLSIFIGKWNKIQMEVIFDF